MSDLSVAQALRSTSSLVVIEAPAGCGKTFQAAEYAREVGGTIQPNRLLILTHTHAACDVFSGRTAGVQRGVEIRTIDSFVVEVATLYHSALALPHDVATWARTNANGYEELSRRVATLLRSAPVVTRALQQRYPVVICDEHQDSNAHQHAVVMAMHQAGCFLRILGDPVQLIFADRGTRQESLTRWNELCQNAEKFEKLDVPHRWSNGAGELGSWILEARELLRSGQRINLSASLPKGLQVIRADNVSPTRLNVIFNTEEGRQVRALAGGDRDILLLARLNETVRGIRSCFYRTVPIWEGHTRPALESLIASSQTADLPALGEAMLDFLEKVGIGFTRSKEGRILLEELTTPKRRRSGTMPALVKELAEIIRATPSHVGIAQALARLEELKRSGNGFSGLILDQVREFDDATRLAQYEEASEGLAALAQRRSHSKRGLPRRAISTVHKSKGLEGPNVVILPCDAEQFKDNDEHRCLLYVAISRATSSLTLVVPRSNPSPLFDIA